MWQFTETLGEGAYGEYVKSSFFFLYSSTEISRVVLAKNVNTNEFAAVKVIDINRLKGNDVVIRKEVTIVPVFLEK
jgi:hypothetical protein